MCVTAVLAAVAVVASAVGTVASIQAANANEASEKYRADIGIKQAKEQRDAARLQALRQENTRASAFQIQRGAALAAIGASGLQEQISFNQAIDPENRKALATDVRTIRLNLYSQESTIRDQIDVAEFSKQIASANAGAQRLGALANFTSDAMNAYSFYNKNKG